MKLRIIPIILLISLMAAFGAFAEEKKFGGEVKLAPTFIDVNGNEAKFSEYRDLDDDFSLFSRLKLGYDSGNYYFKFKAGDIGYDTQSYRLDGGMWGKFKYNLFYNEIPHNITYDARTFYSGAGNGTLTFTPPIPAASAWKMFDYSTERKRYGGGIGIDVLKPFFFNVSYQREEKEGIKPTANNLGSPGGTFAELPEPIDYVTNNLTTEVGYATRPFFASLSLFYSTFENDNEILTFTSAAAGNPTDRMSLPPDNDYYKVAFKSALQLPLNSRFNVNLARSRTEADFNLIRNFVYEGIASTATYTIGGVPVTKFDGELETTNYAFVLTSNPVSFLNGKVFYKYYDKKNTSDEITQTDTASGATVVNHRFDYRKSNAGIELGFKLPAKFSLITGYNYYRIKRDDREDFPKTTDNLYSVELRWSGIDFMTAKVGYEYLDRDGDFDDAHAASLTGDARVEQFVRRFDAASQKRDIFKAGLDLYPTDNLNVGLEYRYKKSDFDDRILGIREDKSYEFGVSADYTIGTLMTIAGYFDYEQVKTYQFQRRFNNGGNPFPFTGTQTNNDYNWDVTQRDSNYDFGVATSIYVVPKKVTLKLSYDHVDSEGIANYTFFNVGGPALANPATALRTNENADIHNWDDYNKDIFMAKVVYNATKSMTVAAGYAYERFKYSDAAVDNYPTTYTFGTTNYLTGAYKDPSYRANVVFLSAAYKF